MPHVPIFASERFKGKSGRGLYGDVIEELDWSVGEILKAVKDNDLDGNTLVLFLSDNGPFLSYGNHAGSAGPLREGKLTTFEGGVRVPFLARWPGKVPAGRVCDELVTGLDLLPTIAKLAGADLPKARIDGVDLSALLLGEKDAVGRPSFAYYSGSELHAVRAGRWKLHVPHEYLTVDGPPGKGGKPANHARMKPNAIEESGIRGIASRHGYRVERIGLSLYDLAADPGESRNAADRHPDVAKRLAALADEFRRDLGDSLTGIKGTGLRAAGRDDSSLKKNGKP
jgi:arylsulfatase